MKSLYELCVPRESVFDPDKRSDVLDLTNLIEDTVNADQFFEENFLTEGMKTLIDTAFSRFVQTGDRGLIKLTQSMGGGKTHNMIALGLLAKFPFLREKVLGKKNGYEKIGKIRVVGFSGRDTDSKFGLWGAIAEQLGKKDLFNSYYSPLQAPGPAAWINLLQGDPVLILIDELPPYLENAKSVTIGNADLAVVTVTALSNLYVAIAKKELSNVCLVISDLRATYESGSDLLQTSFKELENETNRYALDIEPVASNTDDVYHILRKRLFATLPDDKEINVIASEYKKVIEEANQMDLSTIDPDTLYLNIKETYPFHPSIRDLFARFKENPGFQQTRGFIRLMRIMISQLYTDNGVKARKKYLINSYDMDLNEREMVTAISQIKNSLTNAISHDIANQGKAIAEEIDNKLGDTVTQDIAKLFLVSSLANVPNATLGLPLTEAIGFLCEPGKNISLIKKGFDDFTIKAWYLHSDRDDNFLFQDTKNIVAQLNSLVESYTNEIAKKELKSFLSDKFKPSLNDCYQDVQIFPAIDELKLSADKVMLVLTEPYSDSKLNPELEKFYDDATFKNRILFLTGARSTMDKLYRAAKEHKAISEIIRKMREEGVTDKDSQFELAQDKEKRLALALLSAAQQTFVTLYYPSAKGLLKADFLMQFKGNSFNGEEQIRQILKDKYKFTEESSGEGFRKKVEDKLFTRKQMPLSEIKERAASDSSWLWYSIRALDTLKDEMLQKDIWRLDGGNYLEKGPFPKEDTSVQIIELRRDDNTGEVTLRLIPRNADKIYYEIGAAATESSLQVQDVNSFVTSELKLSFLAVDSAKEHPTGKPVEWSNRISLKYKQYNENSKKMMELASAPPAKIKYTTDGSEPKNNGGVYTAPFEIPEKTSLILAVAEEKGIYSPTLEIDVKQDIDKIQVVSDKPLKYRASSQKKTKSTRDLYETLTALKKRNAGFSNVTITLNDEVNDKWIELNFSEDILLSIDEIEKQIDNLRGTFLKESQINITMGYRNIIFPQGQDFLDWAAEKKLDIDKEFDRQELQQ